MVTPADPSTRPGVRRIPGHPAAYWGIGVLRALTDVLGELAARRVLVVHGRSSFVASGAASVVASLPAAVEVHHFDQVSPNPEWGQFVRVARAVRTLNPDTVVGVGGGSVLDSAKAGVVLAAQPELTEAPLPTQPVTVPRARRLVLVPTTSGSGSELTRFATAYHKRRKHSLESDQMVADVVLIDPELTASLTAATAAASTLDALAHAIESYWSVTSTPESRDIATRAVASLASALGRALTGSGWAEPAVRADLAWGAALAGLAIDHTRTTAAHALSYWLTAHRQVPHGAAVALHLRWLMNHHRSATEQNTCHPEGARTVRRRVAEVDSTVLRHSGHDVDALLSAVLRVGGHPEELAELGLADADQRASFTESTASARAANNPCLITASDVVRAFSTQGAVAR